MPIPSKVELSGGAFQDSEGNPLALGYLKFMLSIDGSVTGVGNVCSGIEIIIQLDVNGNVVAGQFIWGNDVITPTNSFYRVTAYAANGQTAWGPNNQQVVGTGTFDVGTWIPNQVISWTPSIQSVILEVNGTLNADQSLLNLVAGGGLTITDEGAGEVLISAGSTSSGLTAFPIPQMNDEDGGLSGYTMVMRIPGTMLTAKGNGLVVSVMTGSNLGSGWVVTGASIAASLNSYFIPGILSPDPSIPWTTSPVAMTFPGGSFSAPSTVYSSNPVAITVDAEHTYYITFHFDPSSSGNIPFANWTTAGAIPQFWNGLFGYILGDHTNDADSTAFGSLSGFGNLHLFVNVAIA